MMLYSIFLVCAVGTKDCTKLYTEIPRPPGMTAEAIPDAAMRQMCLDNNKDDHSFDKPVFSPKGVQVKITPADCVLGDVPPPGVAPANSFIGYHE